MRFLALLIRRPWIRKVVWLLVVGQVGTATTIEGWTGTSVSTPRLVGATRGPQQARQPNTPAARPTRVVPNRTRPSVTSPPLAPTFSANPTADEIRRARVFQEPLVAIGTPSAGENNALSIAITAYLTAGNREDVEPFGLFLAAHPESAWRPSLLAQVAVVYARHGFFSRALEVWDGVWRATRALDHAGARVVADFAVGEWCELATKFGMVELLELRLDELRNRMMGGTAAAKVAAAREGVWFLKNLHHEAVFSGPEALASFLRASRGEATMVPAAVKAFHPGPAGTSLAELHALATEIDVPLQMAFRPIGGKVVVPSIVHLRSQHFTTVIAERDGHYVLRDPALGGEIVVSAAALDDEASGYALVPSATLPEGWRTVSESEAATVIGRCLPGAPAHQDPPCGGGGGGPFGMPVYDFHPTKASLLLSDIPVGYTPPRGPAVHFRLTYDHREDRHPQAFSFGNTGQKWSFDWMSYVTDNLSAATPPNVWTTVFLPGCGQESYTGMDTGTGEFPRHWRSRAVLVRTSASPIRYERRLADGSVEVFAQSDGGPTTPGRRIFLTERIDPQGLSLTYTYDSQLRLVAVTDALDQVTTLSYDHPTDPLKITEVTDPFDRSAALTYDDLGRLASITDVIGLTSSFTYLPGDFVSTLTTPYGTTSFRRETDWSQDVAFRFVEATSPTGETEHLEFRWVTTAVDDTEPTGEVPTGLSFANNYLDHYNTFYWDARAWSSAPGDVAAATITHWLLGADLPYWHELSRNIPHSIKRPLERRVWFRYPDQPTGTGRTVGVGTQPARIARVLGEGSTQDWLWTYNTQGKVTSATDPLGRQTTISYAANGLDPLEVRQTTSGGSDLLTSFDDYTAGHHPRSITDAAGETTTLTYNAADQVLTVTNAKSETSTFVYDSDGYRTSLTGPVTGATTAYTYDGYGRVETITDSDSATLTLDYDALDRLTQVTYPDTSSEGVTYDRLDVGVQRDRLGRVTRFSYDGMRRLVAVRDPLGRVVRQQWSGADLDRLIDAKGQTTTWERDVQGRVEREVRADSTTETTYDYDPVTGRLSTVTDPKAQVTTYGYAKDDSVTSLTFSEEEIATPDVTFAYDAVYRRVTTMTDGTGTTSYTYHAAGLAGAGQVATVDGPLTSDVISYTYDELGRPIGRAINSVGLTRTYDALGRVTEEENVLGTFDYGYDGVTTRLASVTYPNGQSATYSYFATAQDHRLQTIHHKYPGGATLSKFDYTHDVVGNILTWQQQADSNAATKWVFGYDAADQLARAVKQTTASTPVVLNRYGYAFDAAGNRTSEQVDTAVTAWTHDSLNRLQTQTGGGVLRFAGSVNEPAAVTINGQPATVSSANQFDRVVPVAIGASAVTVTATDPNGNAASQIYDVSVASNAATFTFDANGNLTDDGTRSFEWDARNQLVAVIVGTHRSEFAYDGLQRRVRIVEKEGGVVQTDTYVLWCGTAICEDRASNGSTVLRRAFDDGEQVSGSALLFAKDHLGSVTEVTDASGALLGRYSYDPWGRRALVGGMDLTSVGYTGHREHALSGTYMTMYRAYDAELAGWLSEDPIGFAGGPNLFAYVGNSPTRFIDPDGLSPKDNKFGDKDPNFWDWVEDQKRNERIPSDEHIDNYKSYKEWRKKFEDEGAPRRDHKGKRRPTDQSERPTDHDSNDQKNQRDSDWNVPNWVPPAAAIGLLGAAGVFCALNPAICLPALPAAVAGAKLCMSR